MIPQWLSYIDGQWHLWIYCCEWSLTLDGTPLAHNESADLTMRRALRVLNGQKLTAVDIEPTDGRTRLTFDLGCFLLTRPGAAGLRGRPGRAVASVPALRPGPVHPRRRIHLRPPATRRAALAAHQHPGPHARGRFARRDYQRKNSAQ
jgi:hypothetical protein